MLRYSLRIGAILLMVTPAIAGSEWGQTISRGMTVYQLEIGEASVTLSCDPDRVFGRKSNGNLIVRFTNHGDPLQVALLAASGQQAGFDVVEGSVAEFRADPMEWAQMVTILKKGGDYAFVSSEDVIQLKAMTALSDIQC